MDFVWDRLNLNNRYQWRQIYKTLTLLDYMLKNGSDQVCRDAQSNLMMLQHLRHYEMREEGKDVGYNVREKAKAIIELISDEQRLAEERRKARENAKKYSVAMGSGGGFGSDSYGSYGFGSESYRSDSYSYSSRSESYDSPPRSPGTARREGGGGFRTGATFLSKVREQETREREGEEEFKKSPAKKDQKTTPAPTVNLLDLDDTAPSKPAPSPTSRGELQFDPISAPAPAASGFDDFNPRGGFASTPAPASNIEWDAFQGSSGPAPAPFPTVMPVTSPTPLVTPSPTPAPAPMASVPSNFWDLSTPAPAPAAASNTANDNKKSEDKLPDGDPWKNKHLFNLDISKPSSSSSSKTPMGGKTPMGAIGGGNNPAKKSTAPPMPVLQPTPVANPTLMMPGGGMQPGYMAPGMTPTMMPNVPGTMPGMMRNPGAAMPMGYKAPPPSQDFGPFM